MAVTDWLAQRDLHHYDDASLFLLFLLLFLVQVSTEIPESTIVPGEARANTQLTNPGVSSTSSSTSSITSSSTSFSVKKGVNTATTDSAMQATTATIKTPTSTQKFVVSTEVAHTQLLCCYHYYLHLIEVSVPLNEMLVVFLCSISTKATRR